MKLYLYLYLVLFLMIAGCNQPDKTADRADEDSAQVDSLEQAEALADSVETGLSVTNIPSLWSVETQPDNSEKLVPPREKKVMTAGMVIKDLNTTYPDITLVYTKISNDTIYIAIPKSDRLTNEIGDTGAYNYLATVVYNLTESDNIKYVNFSFEMGEHASPGTYERDNFKRLR